jgi:hypothetical protein
VDILDPAKEYGTKTDEELLSLALDSNQLTAEASAALHAELTRRRLTDSEGLNELREQERKRKDEQGRARRRWQTLFWFFAHLAAVYLTVKFWTPRLAGWTWGTLLPLLQLPTSLSSFAFLFSHIFVFSFVPAFVAGLVMARFRPKAAQTVWLIPTVILAYKLVSYRAGISILSHSWPAFHHYFGGDFLIPEFYDWHQFWSMVGSSSDMTRGIAQLTFTAPFYAGVGYSLAAWICHRTRMDRILSEKVKKWEEWKFGNPA